MNIEQRKKLVETGNVRSLYGGKYDGYFDASMLFLPLILIYFFANGDIFSVRYIPLYAVFALFFGFSLASRLWTAKLKLIGASSTETLFSILDYLKANDYIIKSAGKYHIEARIEDRPLSKGVHIFLFLFEGKLYASAWKFTRSEASKFWHYLPIYLGKDQISLISELNSNFVNKSMQSTAIATDD